MIDIDKSLEIAKDAALLAGKFLISANNDAQKILIDDGRDIKLQIDQDAENLITEYISTRSNLPILGEEFGHKGNLGSTFWVIDPLDGTSNYFRNIPICAVSIALMHNNESIIGVINDFFSENLYFASKEKGAFVNNKRINVSDISEHSKGTIVTGIPSKKEYSKEYFSRMIDDFKCWKKVRMIGSAAIANTFVAAGKAEMYREEGIFLWDIAAGAIIVREAGGKISMSTTDNKFRLDAEFTNGKV